MKKTAGIITQARMGSTRLPGKVMKTINNHSLLHYHLERLKWAGLPIVVATTVNEEDKVIEDYCHDKKYKFFRGSEEDVLSRFYFAAEKFGLDPVIRVTSDCPLIDGKLIGEGLSLFANCDYLSNTLVRTFPRGFDFEIFSFSVLEIAHEKATKKADREHVTPFLYRNSEMLFSLKNYAAHSDNSHIRITVDTPRDFQLIKVLIQEYNCHRLSHREIIQIFKETPSLLAINAEVSQKKYGE